MKSILKLILTIGFLLDASGSAGQNTGGYNGIYSGTPWFDSGGNIISAHAAGITKFGNRYYLFGEKHIDSSNAFAGFTCYSSADLYNWKNEGLALSVQDTGRLGPNTIGERPKVIWCSKTGEYVMYMHSDDLNYKNQCVGYASSRNITGPYKFIGPLLFNGKPIRKWDMGVFQDTDGSGYVLTHGGVIYKLSDDYRSVTQLVADNKWPGSEAPAVFKKNGVYFWLTSHLTSWERNDNYYFTAASLKGPWTPRGIFAPEGTLTWNSQTTFVLPVEGTKDTTFMFMGDRWSFPLQASSATYVWQPLLISGTTISMPTYQQGWAIDTKTGIWSAVNSHPKVIVNTNKKVISYTEDWETRTLGSLPVKISDSKNACFSVKFTGTQIGFYGLADKNGGYVKVVIQDSKEQTLLSAIVDMYCNFPQTSLKFLSPVLKKGDYKLTVFVIGEHSKWSDKKKTDYGSTGNFIALDKIIINE